MSEAVGWRPLASARFGGILGGMQSIPL